MSAAPDAPIASAAVAAATGASTDRRREALGSGSPPSEAAEPRTPSRTKMLGVLTESLSPGRRSRSNAARPRRRERGGGGCFVVDTPRRWVRSSGRSDVPIDSSRGTPATSSRAHIDKPTPRRARRRCAGHPQRKRRGCLAGVPHEAHRALDSTSSPGVASARNQVVGPLESKKTTMRVPSNTKATMGVRQSRGLRGPGIDQDAQTRLSHRWR